MTNYLDEARAGMSHFERKVFAAVAGALGHTRESLEVDGDAVATLRKVAVDVGKELEKEAVEQVGEALFDAAHEHCDDSEGCTGGGAPWYNQVAARLVDPYGPLAAIAVAQQMNADAASPGRQKPDTAAWFSLLMRHIRLVRHSRHDRDALWRSLVDLAAAAAGCVADLADTPSPEQHEEVGKG